MNIKSKIAALTLLAAAGMAVAPAAMAQYYNPGGALLGGLIGGAIGNSAFSGHNRNDRAAATAGLAIVGAAIGSQTGNGYYQPQAYYSGPAPVVYGDPVYYSERPRAVYVDPVVYGYPHYREGWRHHYRHW
jgi:hypothetical protein